MKAKAKKPGRILPAPRGGENAKFFGEHNKKVAVRTCLMCGAYSDENRHQFQSNVGHYFQRKPCHLFRLNHSQSFHSKVGH